MQPTHLHSWDVDEAEAKKIQLRLARLVVSENDFSNVDLIGGVNVRPIATTTVQAAVCVLDVAAMKLVDSAIAQMQSNFQLHRTEQEQVDK